LIAQIFVRNEGDQAKPSRKLSFLPCLDPVTIASSRKLNLPSTGSSVRLPQEDPKKSDHKPEPTFIVTEPQSTNFAILPDPTDNPEDPLEPIPS
jgi:hypothetical protein